MKRFKVVRRADGVWGILDTEVLRHLGEAQAFAGFRFWAKSHAWIDLMVDYAVKLNTCEINRDGFAWESYEARR